MATRHRSLRPSTAAKPTGPQVAVEPDTINGKVANDLRRVADWLDEHPELPDVKWAHVAVRDTYSLDGSNARKELATVAAALGPWAVEQLKQDRVTISCKFGSVSVEANALVTDLGGEKTVVKYDPIIPVEHGPVPTTTDFMDEALVDMNKGPLTSPF